MLKKLFGIEYTANLDIQLELVLNTEEALAGGEKEIEYIKGNRKKKLMVKIPAGITTGAKIRLKGMGLTKKGKTGDLFVNIKIIGRSSLDS